MKKITINVFNVLHTDTRNYITSIEMPDYKQLKRIKRFLAEYVRKQSSNDFKHKKCRFYVFQGNGFVIRESDLTLK
jgi:hypothetical protein